MKHVDHIGIAVKNLETSVQLFESLLNTNCYKKETVASENVITAFFKTGETKIELLQDGTENGVINKFIQSKGEGIHHIAFEVKDIKKEIERLKKAGFIILNEEAKQGADNKMVCFLHPKSTNSVLIELCEQIASSEQL